MLSGVTERIRRLRIRLSANQVAPGLYHVCPHWWSWWIPNVARLWEFIDDAGNLHYCSITYGTRPVVVSTTGVISGGIWFGAPPVEVVYGSELDTRTKNADIPTLYILMGHRGRIERLSYPEATATAILIVPQSSKWAAGLSAQMHDGMLEAIKDVMDRALVDVLDATWIPLYNANMAGTGSGLPGEANSLLMTLRWRKYD